MTESKMKKIAENKFICDNQFKIGNSVVINAKDEGLKTIKNEDMFDYLTDSDNDNEVICSRVP